MRTKPLQQTSMGVIQSDSRSWIIYIFFLLDSSYRQTSPSHTHTHITIIFITQRALKCAGREKLFKQQKLFKCQSPEIRRRRRSKDVTKKKKKKEGEHREAFCAKREKLRLIFGGGWGGEKTIWWSLMRESFRYQSPLDEKEEGSVTFPVHHFWNVGDEDLAAV